MNNFTGNHFGLGLRSRFMKKFFVVLGILATILIATRPSASDHKEAVSNTLQEMVNEEILSGADSTSNILSDSFSMLATTFCGAVIQIVTSHLMTVDDYWICSVGKIKMGEKEKTVSFGILGHVFTFDKETLSKAAEKNIDKQKRLF